MIPKNAKVVFKGVIFDVYHWKKKWYNGEMRTVEGIKRNPTVQIIATMGDKVVLIKEKQPHTKTHIGLPGGFIESKDTKDDALRELQEETGLKPKKIVFWKKMRFVSKVEWDTYYYIAKDCKKVSKQKLDGGEDITPFLVSFDEFVKITSKEGFWNGDFSNYMFRIKQEPKKLEEFRKLLFGK